MMAVLLPLLLFIITEISTTSAQTNCTTTGSVRLQGLSVSHAGRVEVCEGGEWGAVCTSSSTAPWGLKNAQTVCRQLGYGTAITTLPTFRLLVSQRASSRDPIHYSNVMCGGDETKLTDCPKSTSTSSCTHFTDAIVVCRTGVGLGDVRLVGHTSDTEGAVEFYDSRLGWTGICADSTWSSNTAAARVVCRQLGFEGGRAFSYSLSSVSLTTSDVPRRGITRVVCDEGSDFSLHQCSTVLTDCSSDSNVPIGWLECERTSAADYTVRLVGGSREGVVEVALNGRWGTICGDASWDVSDVTVVCQEVGVTTNQGYSTSPSGDYSRYISRMKPYWLSGLLCSSATDDSVSDCSRDLLEGYSISCNPSTSTSVTPDTAKADCGDIAPSSLSGGAIAGIVIGSIAAVFLIVMAFIYLPRYWQKRHQSAWWKRLTTPSTWFQREVRQRPQPSRQEVAMATAAIAEATPPPHAEVITEATTTTTTTSATETNRPQDPPRSDGDLTTACPPPYQSAINYPTASPLPPPPPPSYPEKRGAFPPTDPSFAYPPPDPSAPLLGLNEQGYPPMFALAPHLDPNEQGYPPPTVAAYPPPTVAAYPPPTVAAYPPLTVAAYPPPRGAAVQGNLPYPAYN